MFSEIVIELCGTFQGRLEEDLRKAGEGQSVGRLGELIPTVLCMYCGTILQVIPMTYIPVRLQGCQLEIMRRGNFSLEITRS